MWIYDKNNPKNTVLISKEDKIPEGWLKGNGKQKGKFYCHNPVEMTMVTEESEIPNGWIRGFGQFKSNKKVWCCLVENTDIRKKFPRNEIPNGWKKTEPGLKLIQKKSANLKGYVGFYNPKTGEMKRLPSNKKPPKGWIKGQPYSGTEGKIGCFDPLTNKISFVAVEDEIPAGWLRGFPKRK